MKKTFQWVETRAALLCGACAILIGLGSAAGWLFQSPWLHWLRAAYVPMQFDTALGLAIAGLGLSLVESRPKIAGACGIFAALLGAATVLEYTLHANLGIDAQLFRLWPQAEVPGRMAINTAVCFLLAGVALAAASVSPRFSPMWTLFGGYGVLIIAGSALTGYGLGIEIAYRWASATRIAVFTAVAFGLLGIGLFQLGWRRITRNRTMWLTLLTGGLVAGTSIITWIAVDSDYRRLGAPRAVPDLMLFTGITRACIAAIVVFLWRNSRERLNRAQVLNSSLRGKVTERDAQLQAMFDAVKVGTWSHDLLSNRTSFRGHSHELFGFPPGTAEHSFEELVQATHPEDREKLREASRRAAGEGGTDIEFRVLWPDGSVHWILAQGGVSEYAGGKPVCLSGINLDITRLKNAEIALQASEAAVRKLNEALERRIRIQTKELVESERRFRLMVEGLQDYAFFMLDTEGHVVSWNKGAERIHGYTAEAILGKHFSILCTAEDIERGHTAEELQLAAESGHFEETSWRLRHDGTRFWASVLVTPVYDEAGDLCGFSKIVRDITERKHAREEIEAQRKRAEDANQAKSRFLASMSHEIRTPMNAILGMIELLWETNLDEDQRHYVEIFRRAGANLMQLINDILDLSKIESGRLELEKAEFDVERAIADVLELLAPKAQDKGIGLRAHLAPDLINRVIGDSTRLRQVLVNLVGNAIKFTNAGEVAVRVENQQGGQLAELAFIVCDTGIGIPQDKLDSIFEPFEQVDASTTRKYGGTGLGLPICRRLVDCMGGVLRVESQPGRGSTFSFTAKFGVPPAMSGTGWTAQPALEPRAAASPRLDHEAIPAANRTVRVLVAEDSPDNQFLIQAYLRGSPYQPAFAGDGRAAVQCFQEETFDLVLMDMEMPVMDGLSATRAIREFEAREHRAATPVLALTANAHREAVAECHEAGCTSHVAKPVSKAALLDALERALAGVSGSLPAPTPDLPLEPVVAPVAVIPEGLESLAPRYLSARRKELPEMVALLAAADFDQIGSRGHNMKGTGRSYGFPDLTEIGAALERSAKHRDKDAVDKQLMRLANYLESVQFSAEPAGEAVS